MKKSMEGDRESGWSNSKEAKRIKIKRVLKKNNEEEKPKGI